MPGAIKYIPPTETARAQFEDTIVQEKKARRDAYRKSLKYYLGDQPDQIDFDVENGSRNDNTIYNMVKLTADRTSTFLFPVVPDVILDPTEIEESSDELWVKNLLEEIGGLQFLIRWVLRGFLSGHTFIRVSIAKPYPKVVLLDPTAVTVYWRVDDVSEVVWYEMRYNVGAVPYIRDFVNDGGRWVIYTYEGQGQINSFPGAYPTSFGEVGTIFTDTSFSEGKYKLIGTDVHQGSYPPILETPHLPHPDSRYGLGEVDQIGLQDAINFAVSTHQRLIRENSDPVDVMTGADPDELTQSDNLVSITSSAARVTRLETNGNMAGISEQINKLVKMYLSVARVVLLQGDAKDLQRVTNTSIRTLYVDMLSKNNILMASYGATLKKMVRLSMEMAVIMGILPKSSLTKTPEIKFANPLPSDQQELSIICQTAIAAGYMSQKTAAELMGLDWKTETANIENEFAISQEHQKAQMALQPPIDKSQSNVV